MKSKAASPAHARARARPPRFYSRHALLSLLFCFPSPSLSLPFRPHSSTRREFNLFHLQQVQEEEEGGEAREGEYRLAF